MSPPLEVALKVHPHGYVGVYITNSSPKVFGPSGPVSMYCELQAKNTCAPPIDGLPMNVSTQEPHRSHVPINPVFVGMPRHTKGLA